MSSYSRPTCRSQRVLVVAAATAVAATLAGCGSSSGGKAAAGGAGSSSGLTNVTVLAGVNLTAAPLHIAVQKGYFKAVGLNVTIKNSANGQNIVPLVLNGQATFATLDTGVAIQATAKNLGVIAVAPNENGETGARGALGLVAKSASITSLKDLVGKTVAVNVLQGTQQILMDATLHNAGVDPAKVKFAETGSLPATIAAVQAGRVDAAVLPEPGQTMALDAGMHIVANPEATSIPGVPAYVYETSQKYATANPGIVAKFAQVVLKANAEATSDPAEVNAISQTYQTPPTAAALLARTHPFQWATTPLSDNDILVFEKLLEAYGGMSAATAPKPSDVYVSQG